MSIFFSIIFRLLMLPFVLIWMLFFVMWACFAFLWMLITIPFVLMFGKVTINGKRLK